MMRLNLLNPWIIVCHASSIHVVFVCTMVFDWNSDSQSLFTVCLSIISIFFMRVVSFFLSISSFRNMHSYPKLWLTSMQNAIHVFPSVQYVRQYCPVLITSAQTSDIDEGKSTAKKITRPPGYMHTLSFPLYTAIAFFLTVLLSIICIFHLVKILILLRYMFFFLIQK